MEHGKLIKHDSIKSFENENDSNIDEPTSSLFASSLKVSDLKIR